MKSEQFKAHADSELRHWWFRGRRTILKTLIDETVAHGGSVLEIGCATGGNLANWQSDFKCVGIDVSDDAIRLARSRFPAVDFRTGIAPDDIREVCASADLILVADVLEHAADDYGLLKNLVASAKDGCWFLLTVPADENLWSPHDESHQHFRRYHADSFAKLWQDLPVQPRLVSYFNARLYPIVRCVRWLSSRFSRSSGAAGTDLFVPPSPVNQALESAFAGERQRLKRVIEGKAKPYRRGVSLVALLQKTATTALASEVGPTSWQEVRLAGSMELPGIPVALPVQASGDFAEPEVCLVVPCYNEQDRLQTDAFISFLAEHPSFRFIFVDDGSRDETLRQLVELHRKQPSQVSVLRLPANLGKAEAVRLGMLHASQYSPKFIGFMDADLATPLSELLSLVEVLRKTPRIQGVLGSRVRLLGRNIQRNSKRHYVGRVGATLISWVLGVAVYDTQCGAKVFRVDPWMPEVLQKPFTSRWLFDVETLQRLFSFLKQAGTPPQTAVVEYPLNTWADIKGSKVRFRDLFVSLADLLRIYLQGPPLTTKDYSQENPPVGNPQQDDRGITRHDKREQLLTTTDSIT
jgi:dolichyl-phosphate beta-glucosyltransferase